MRLSPSSIYANIEKDQQKSEQPLDPRNTSICQGLGYENESAKNF